MSIAAVIQSQMLQTLLAALQAADQPARSGEMVRATLLSLDQAGPEAGGEARLAARVEMAGKPVTLLLQADPSRRQALIPGAVLTLMVETPGAEDAPATMRLVSIAPPEAAASGQLATGKPELTLDTARPAQLAPPSLPAEVMRPEAARALAGPILGAAMARQNGLAPLFADLEALFGARNAAALSLPAPVAEAARAVLAQRLDGAGTQNAAALKRAVAQSGLFHEARQAAGETRRPDADLKGALLALRDSIRSALAPLTASAAEQTQPRIAAGGPQAPLDGTTPAPPDLELPTSARPDRPSARPGAPDTPSQPVSVTRPPPPLREGLPVPQPAQAASAEILAGSPASALAKVLEGTEAALDRIALSQYASLPSPADMGQPQLLNRWSVELPLMLDGRTMVLPLEIEEDQARASDSATGAGRLWRVRFALDVEPIGPLHALVTLQGKVIGVSVWAERPATTRLIHAFAPDLEAALLDSDFSRAEIEIRTGQPTPRAPQAGHFLDRRT